MSMRLWEILHRWLLWLFHLLIWHIVLLVLALRFGMLIWNWHLLLLLHVQVLLNISSERIEQGIQIHTQLSAFLILSLTCLMLELHKGLNEHTVGIEHEGAVVSMLLNFSVIVKSSTAFTLERTDLWICRIIHHHHVSTWCRLKAIALLVVHLLLIVLKLLIIQVLVLILWVLTSLIISRLLLHIHPLIIFLIDPVNFPQFTLLLFLAGENIRHRICFTNSSNYNQRF